jgi:hypothetical protein
MTCPHCGGWVYVEEQDDGSTERKCLNCGRVV